ncbi:MAG TPA: sensor domain-containing protein [Streptosporangiaceae bacterium]
MSSKAGPRAREAGSRPSAGGGPRPAGGAVRTLLGAPFTLRAWRELLYSVAGVPLGVAGFALTAVFLGPATVLTISLVGTVLGLVLLMTGLGVARLVSAAQRALAAGLLGERLPQLPPHRPAHGMLRRVDARLRDGAGWRAVAAAIAGLPIAVAKYIAVLWWAYGVFSLTSPAWWLMFRNHPAGTHLSPIEFGGVAVQTWPGTWLAAVAGGATLLVAPWMVHGIVVAELGLSRRILGPGEMAARVATLERSRSEVVNEAAALVRQIERNLHDGAQTRLATLALLLGMARDKLAAGGPDDVAAARDLVDAAHAGAKEALVELRDLSSGIHPPVLDNGLGPALENLAAGSAIPVRVTAHLPERPSPAIETIAYFSAAELLANAVKHSSANVIEVAATSPPGGPFVLTVTDDGRGGANEANGSGLSGLRHRARTVDGTITVTSPPGGPTTVSVELPLHP